MEVAHNPAAILLARIGRWSRDWMQRDIVEGDELSGLKWPSFLQLVKDTKNFQ